jgi:hypothetical protein
VIWGLHRGDVTAVLHELYWHRWMGVSLSRHDSCQVCATMHALRLNEHVLLSAAQQARSVKCHGDGTGTPPQL